MTKSDDGNEEEVQLGEQGWGQGEEGPGFGQLPSSPLPPITPFVFVGSTCLGQLSRGGMGWGTRLPLP